MTISKVNAVGWYLATRCLFRDPPPIAQLPERQDNCCPV